MFEKYFKKLLVAEMSILNSPETFSINMSTSFNRQVTLVIEKASFIPSIFGGHFTFLYPSFPCQ
jgi:hypothetical protein